MPAWLGGFEGGLAPGIPAAGIEGFKDWLFDQPKFPGLRLVALHNSAAPNIAQTDKTPGGYDQRQKNIAPGYKKKGWRGGPAFNVYPDGTIRGGTPWGKFGVHSPSWNDIGIGIEMMADFSGPDDDDTGKGLVIKNTACEMIAAILFHQGLPVSTNTVKLHKQDPRTTHPCPGKDVVLADIYARVEDYYNALTTPGEHLEEPDAPDPTIPNGFKFHVVTVDDLNLRASPGMAGKVIGKLNKQQLVKVWSKSKNASTDWAHVTGTRDAGASYFDGHVALAYLKEVSTQPVPDPTPETPKPKPPEVPTTPPPVIQTPTDRPYWAGKILMGPDVGWPAHWAAGGVGAAQVESYKDLRVHAAGDKDESGKATAFTIWQLRNDRHDAFKVYAKNLGKSEDDFETQVKWPAIEMPTSEKLAWKWLQQAKTVEEAAAAFAFYERPSGYVAAAAKAAKNFEEVLAVARKVSHWDWRLQYAKDIYKRIA